MTPAQKAEIRRLTPLMRSLLRAASPDGCQVGGHHLHSARLLDRRGFMRIEPDAGGWYLARLSAAGIEAVATMRRSGR